MKLENQLATIEQSKRLKELGVSQESQFAHVDIEGGPHKAAAAIHGKDFIDWSTIEGGNHFAAFTVAELGVMLPDGFVAGGAQIYSLRVPPVNQGSYGEYCCCLPNMDERNPDILSFYESTEAQARAAMLIYLLETGTIKVESVNSRLT